MSRIFCVCAVQKRCFSLGKKTSLSPFREARPPYGFRGGNLGTMSCPHWLLALRLLLVCVLGAVRSGAGPYHRRTLLPATARYASGHLLIALYRFASHLFAMTGEVRGGSRAAAPGCGFSRGTMARSVSLSWGAREVGSPCEWRGGARTREKPRGSPAIAR